MAQKYEWIPISEVRPYENNPRNNEAAVEKVAETVDKVIAEMEYKFEIGAIIALLRKLLTATWDFNIAHRKHIGVMVEDVLNFLIDAMEEQLKKEAQEDEGQR